MATAPTRLPATIDLNSTQAIALGVLAAQTRMVFTTQTSPIIHSLHQLTSGNNMPLQIDIHPNILNALGMTLGSAVAGVRSMLLLSGEDLPVIMPKISSAFVAEVPIVVGVLPNCHLDYESLAKYEGIVLNASSPLENFLLLQDAANVAEQYQLPVIVLLAGGQESVKSSLIKVAMVQRGQLLTAKQVTKIKNYARYEVTATGISPRKIPGQSGEPALVSFFFHDHRGVSTSADSEQIFQLGKRLTKMEAATKQLLPLQLFGNANAPIIVVCSGDTTAMVLDAVKQLSNDNVECSVLQILSLAPFPTAEISALIRPVQHVAVLESNPSGLPQLIQQKISMKLSAITAKSQHGLTASEIKDCIRSLFTFKGAVR